MDHQGVELLLQIGRCPVSVKATELAILIDIFMVFPNNTWQIPQLYVRP